MQGFARILLGSAAAVALACSATALSTTEASAQFPLPGLFGPMHGFPQGGGGRRRARSHEARHERHSRSAKEEDKGRDDKQDKHDKQSAQANDSDHGSHAEDKGPPQSSPPSNGNTSKQPVTEDVPSLTPER